MPAWGTWIILAVSVAIFLTDMSTQRALTEWGAKSSAIWAGEVHRLFTATFLHADLRHLFFNMYALFMFGRVVEAVLGSLRFMVVYLISGAIGYMLSLLVSPENTAVGASAAIFGLMGYTLHYRLRRLPLRFMRIDTELLQILGLNLIIGFLVPRIDQMAHLGGLFGGIVTASLVGMPTPHHKQKRNLSEPLLAAVFISILTWITCQPVAVAARVQSVSPIAARWLDTRYGRYFSYLWADSITLLWMPVQPGAGWEPFSGITHVSPGRSVRLAVFWRWERGAGAYHSVPYVITWEKESGSGTYQRIQEEQHQAVKPDADKTLIYARSDIVVGAGRYRVRVSVDGREIWRSTALIQADTQPAV